MPASQRSPVSAKIATSQPGTGRPTDVGAMPAPPGLMHGSPVSMMSCSTTNRATRALSRPSSA
jgi:hypothetical protein